MIFIKESNGLSNNAPRSLKNLHPYHNPHRSRNPIALEDDKRRSISWFKLYITLSFLRRQLFGRFPLQQQQGSLACRVKPHINDYYDMYRKINNLS